jgi:hypothetical protein
MNALFAGKKHFHKEHAKPTAGSRCLKFGKKLFSKVL